MVNVPNAREHEATGPRVLAIRRRRWLAWVLIAAAAVIAFSLGVYGFAQYYADSGSDPSSADLLYYSARLFMLEWDIKQGQAIPWSLEVARWLAPLSLSAAAVKTILDFARTQVELALCRLRRKHAVVCGLGPQGKQLVDELTRAGTKVTAIELDPNNPNLGSVHDTGAFVLIGNATDTALLTAAAVKHAHFVFAVAGEDETNVEIALGVLNAWRTQRRRRARQRCVVHVENPQIADLVGEGALLQTDLGGLQFHFYNINRLAARTLINAFPPDRFQQVHHPEDPAASISIFGAEPLALELLLQIARVGHYGNKKRPVVQLATRLGDQMSEYVDKRVARLAQLVQVKTNEVDFDLLVGDDGMLESFVSPETARMIYVCLPSAVDSLRLAIALERIGVSEHAKVVVCLSQTGDAPLLDLTGDDEKKLGFVTFDVWRETCTLDGVLGGSLDRLARAIHEDYLRQQSELGVTPEMNTSLVEWSALPETLREANRSQADHLSVKLRLLGYDPPDHPPPGDLRVPDDCLELLAEVEHRRWLVEKKLAGWRHTTERKDAARRLSPAIVAWKKLSEEEKDKDRKTAYDLPRLAKLQHTLELAKRKTNA